METKKKSEHNLEKRYSLRLFAGLAVAVSITLVAFEWRTPETIEIVLSDDPDDGGIIIDIIPPTKIEDEIKKQPELPKLQPKVILPSDQIKIVDNTTTVSTDSIKFADPDSAVTTTTKFFVKLPDEEEGEPLPPYKVDEMPKFKCSEDETLLNSYLTNNTKYPRRAIDIGSSGTAYVQFVVDKKGKVTDVKLARGFDRDCDAEALRVVNSLPDFCPGLQGGKAVPVIYTVPVRFVLQ